MSVVIQEGFRVLPQVLTQDEIGALRAAIEDSINRVARVMLTRFERSFPGIAIEERLEMVARHDRAYASALLQVVMADAQHDSRIAGLIEHPALASVLREAIAPEMPTGHVVRTRAAIPSFAAQISPWHQDVLRPGEKTGRASVRLAAWIPLANVDEHTGALEVMPGVWQAPCPHEMADGHFAIPEEALPGGHREVVPMHSGDVLLLDRFAPHRALPIRGMHGRWSVVIWVKAGGERSLC